ncbi:spindle assembly abnormal protein 6-like [Physella acuta]|uniref:spindle assembly abnormal protein 6-like n=1 Tax=Physella acuta TaxID=109671 RepID=UPI0027DD602C|nr:spindle assembly abnormal protein 6-like [Physella acuta]
MSLNERSRKHLNNLMQELDDIHVDLQEHLSEYVKKITSRIKDWMNDPSGKSMTLKEAMAVVTSANNSLLENIDMINEKMQFPSIRTHEMANAELSLREADEVRHDSNDVLTISPESMRQLESRIEAVETAIMSFENTKILVEDTSTQLKQCQEIFDKAMEKKSKTQKAKFKNIGKQLHEQSEKIKDLNEVIEFVKEEKSDANKELEKLSLDMKEYENNLHKINKDMQDYTDKTECITQELRCHSDLISVLQEDGKKINDLALNKFEKLQTKYGMTCTLLLRRLAPIEKIFASCKDTSARKKENSLKIGQLEKVVFKINEDVSAIAQLQKSTATKQQALEQKLATQPQSPAPRYGNYSGYDQSFNSSLTRWPKN